jgi:hypothetical protein
MLPDQCTLEVNELVFWEVADPTTLADDEKIYEYACFTACTNGLRPSGMTSVQTSEFPELDDDDVALWGKRSMTAEAIRRFRADGLVLAKILLPVAAMGGDARRAVADADGTPPHRTPPAPPA